MLPTLYWDLNADGTGKIAWPVMASPEASWIFQAIHGRAPRKAILPVPSAFRSPCKVGSKLSTNFIQVRFFRNPDVQTRWNGLEGDLEQCLPSHLVPLPPALLLCDFETTGDEYNVG